MPDTDIVPQQQSSFDGVIKQWPGEGGDVALGTTIAKDRIAFIRQAALTLFAAQYIENDKKAKEICRKAVKYATIIASELESRGYL